MSHKPFSRRQFLKAGVYGTSGLLLAFHLPVSGGLVPYGPWPQFGAELNAWLAIDTDDSITIRVAKAEMGQGVFTALPMIIAEELEADWRQVRAEFAEVTPHLQALQVAGSLLTANSGSVRNSREVLQRVGAEARQRLLQAAAVHWGVPVGDCRADYGSIRNRSGEALRYGALAAAATEVSVGPVNIKSPRDFNLLGLPTPSLGAAAKVDGTAKYGIDVRLPGMVYAVVLHSPVLGGEVRSLRFNAIRNLPGVIEAVRMASSIGVVAEHFWQAKTAADKLPVYWDNGGYDKSSSQRLKDDFVQALEKPGQVLRERGDIVRAMDEAETSFESDYISPYLSQAALEPLNCTVSIENGRLDLWVGTQDPEQALAVAAAAAGLPLASVTLHPCLIGGSFGRRRSMDFIREAVTIAKSVGRPVQMIWTREEEQRGGQYRPMAAVRFKAGFDLDKRLVAYTSHSVTHSLARDQEPGFQGLDETSVEGLTDLPFGLEHLRLSHTDRNTHITAGFWRSRGHSQNAFAKECFLDEIAAASGQDPLNYRRALYRGNEAVSNVLETLKEVSGWGLVLRNGAAHGVALHECFGSICGQVAVVHVARSGKLTVERIVSVLDCGNLVNPLIAEAQVESGVVFGLSAALYGKLTIENGVVLEDNYDTYQVVRMADMPKLETHFIDAAGDKWGGLGEVAVPTVAPAVCNALYRITGRRIRALPIRDYLLSRSR